jgi:hypothetical protein
MLHQSGCDPLRAAYMMLVFKGRCCLFVGLELRECGAIVVLAGSWLEPEPIWSLYYVGYPQSSNGR